MARQKETKKSFGIKRRMTIVVAIITLSFFIVIASLAIVSIINHEKYTSIAISQQIRDSNVAPTRGSIYDANMNVLAESATVYTVALSPLDIKEENYEKIADGLSRILGVDRQEIFDQCHEQSYYSIVKRKVDQPVVEQIRNWMSEERVGGITFSEDAKRYYPYGNFLSQVLGFVGTDNYGLSGLEAYYNDYLSGIAGRVITAQNAHGTETFYSNETNYEVTKGYSLVLTVDDVIQTGVDNPGTRASVPRSGQEPAAGVQRPRSLVPRPPGQGPGALFARTAAGSSAACSGLAVTSLSPFRAPPRPPLYHDRGLCGRR